MVASGMPAALAVVAAPILKLWPLNCDPSRPVDDRACWTTDVNWCRTRGELSS